MMRLPIIEITPSHLITSDLRAWPLAQHKITFQMRADSAYGWYLIRIGRPGR